MSGEVQPLPGGLGPVVRGAMERAPLLASGSVPLAFFDEANWPLAFVLARAEEVQPLALAYPLGLFPPGPEGQLVPLQRAKDAPRARVELGEAWRLQVRAGADDGPVLLEVPAEPEGVGRLFEPMGCARAMFTIDAATTAEVERYLRKEGRAP